MIVSANELKIKGVSFIDKLLKKYNEIFITFRGKKKFVVLSIDEYEKLKEAELEKIIRQAENDYTSGKVIKETADEHFKRLGI